MAVNCFMVRDRASTTNNEYVAIGWNDIDLSVKSYAEIKDQVNEVFKNDHPVARGNRISQLINFINIKKSDIIIVPYYKCVRIGKALQKTNDSSIDSNYSNILYIDYYKDKYNNPIEIPRVSLTEALQKRIASAGGTIRDLRDFKPEIHRICKTIEREGTFSFAERNRSIIAAQKEIFINLLLKRIQDGNTNLEGKGAGLEKIVEELMQIQGYITEIPSKRKYKGIADIDIIATKHDDFLNTTTTIIIQVKHHKGTSGDYGIQQLCECVNLEDVSYDYMFFITSGDSISEKARESANNKSIRVICGRELAAWIYDSLPKLTPETKRNLHISDIPQFID